MQGTGDGFAELDGRAAALEKSDPAALVAELGGLVSLYVIPSPPLLVLFSAPKEFEYFLQSIGISHLTPFCPSKYRYLGIPRAQQCSILSSLELWLGC